MNLVFSAAVAYARSLMLVLISMIVSPTSLHFFVSSFVLACVCAYVASEDQTLMAGVYIECFCDRREPLLVFASNWKRPLQTHLDVNLRTY